MEVARSFLSLVKARSSENNESFNLLYDHGKYSVCIGLLRQELDTLLRLYYLWRSETTDNEAGELMKASIQGKKWKYLNEKGKLVKLTDSNMLQFALFLGGWEKVVYDFGCKAIHLSDLHAYQTRDPFELVNVETKNKVIAYLKSCHGYDKQSISMDSLYEYLPKVMEKLSENVAFYIEELEDRYAKG